MMEMPDMRHEEPGAVRVAPGAEGEIVWRFTAAGRLTYACLIPGQIQAGMLGTIEVVPDR